ADLEHLVGAAVEAGREHAGRDTELVHQRDERLRADRSAVAAEVAGNVLVALLARELFRRLVRDEVDPKIDNLHRAADASTLPVMRAALLEAAEKPLLVVDDVDIDEPRVGEVLTRVTNCGVCHSDLLPWEGTIPFMGTAVLGHEAAGVVERVGPGVTQVKP